MEILRLRSADPQRLARIVRRAGNQIFAPEVMDVARRTLDEVAERGDDAVVDSTRRVDGVDLRPEQLRVQAEEFRQAYDEIDDGLRAALGTAIDRARRFNERLRPLSWLETLEDGILVGVRYTPINAVGAYVPSGKGRFPSTAVTILTPAVVAGVPRINVLVPPRQDGRVDPAVLVVCDLLGVQQVFRANGVAGIAAFAVGTASIPAVPAIVGPGNPYVVAAQLVAQTRGVRMLALLGPTEAVVLADGSADPHRLALDLVNEAEHGTDSAVVLVTEDPALAEEVLSLLPRILARVPEPRRTFAEAALTDYGGLLVTDSMDEAIAFVNAYAPEHLQIATREPLGVLEQIQHAGEILIGQDTPFSAGNYAIGVPAALPTGGAARMTGGVSVLSFLKVSSVARLDATGLTKVRPIVERLGHYEGFPAHVLAVTDR